MLQIEEAIDWIIIGEILSTAAICMFYNIISTQESILIVSIWLSASFIKKWVTLEFHQQSRFSWPL